MIWTTEAIAELLRPGGSDSTETKEIIERVEREFRQKGYTVVCTVLDEQKEIIRRAADSVS